MKLNRIKDILEQKGISQTWLAKQVGKSFSTINSYACNRYLEKTVKLTPKKRRKLTPKVVEQNW